MGKGHAAAAPERNPRAARRAKAKRHPLPLEGDMLTRQCPPCWPAVLICSQCSNLDLSSCFACGLQPILTDHPYGRALRVCAVSLSLRFMQPHHISLFDSHHLLVFACKRLCNPFAILIMRITNGNDSIRNSESLSWSLWQ